MKKILALLLIICLFLMSSCSVEPVNSDDSENNPKDNSNAGDLKDVPKEEDDKDPEEDENQEENPSHSDEEYFSQLDFSDDPYLSTLGDGIYDGMTIEEAIEGSFIEAGREELLLVIKADIDDSEELGDLFLQAIYDENSGALLSVDTTWGDAIESTALPTEFGYSLIFTTLTHKNDPAGNFSSRVLGFFEDTFMVYEDAFSDEYYIYTEGSEYDYRPSLNGNILKLYDASVEGYAYVHLA